MVGLYNATDGENWRNNANWLSDAPPGEWEGVYTDDDVRVTWLELNYNRLIGKIPAEMGSLSNLTWLDLRNNELSGCAPSSLEDRSTSSDFGGLPFC